MNHYQTLTGEVIDLGTLRGSLQLFVHTMIAHTGEGEGAENADREGLSANDFASQVREHLHVQYPEPEAYASVMRGAVGTIYRDCFYRLFAKEYAKEKSGEDNTNGDKSVEQEREREFIHNIRYNPARILVDRFLEDPATQVQFSREAGLDTATVSRLFSFVFDPGSDREPSLGLARLAHTCERLQVVPLAGYHPSSESANALTHPLLNSSSGGFTTRERQLRAIVAAVTRCVCVLNGHKDREELMKLRAFLGLHLAALYGVSDVLALHRMTAAVFDDILRLPEIEEIPSQAHEAEQSEPYNLEANSLLDFFEEFNLGVGHNSGTVAFATTEIKGVIEKALDQSRQQSYHSVSDNKQPKSRFAHLRAAVHDNWDRALRIFKDWYESELFLEWDTTIEGPLTMPSGDGGLETGAPPNQTVALLRNSLVSEQAVPSEPLRLAA